MQINRIPPCEIDAEESFLSICIIEDRRELSELLQPDDFYRSAHQKIHQAIIDIYSENESVTLTSVASKLSEKKQLEDVGGASYLAQLINEIPMSVNPEQDSMLIKRAATKRKLIHLCNEVTVKCFEMCDNSEIINDLQTGIQKINDNIDCDSWIRMSELSELATELWESNKNKKGLTGVTSGLIEVDKALGGFQPGNLYIIAARPGMGKSAFAFCVGKSAARKKHPVGIISIEMGKLEVVTRTTSDISGVDGERFRSGEIEPSQWGDITNALAEIHELEIYIDDTPTANILSVQRKIRSFLKKIKPDNMPLILIDYLQYIEGVKSERKDIEIGTVTRGLKALSKELKIPIVLLSQLSRKVEDRDNKRPRRSDLRNSGEIEQDADVICFLYRDEYYNPQTTKKPGTVEFIIDKFRAGKTGTIELAWIAHRTAFENLAR